MGRVWWLTGVLVLGMVRTGCSQDEEARCPPAPQVPNASGSEKCFSAKDQEVCTYTCAPGFNLEGEANITCDASELYDEEWIGDPPFCIPIECDEEVEGTGKSWYDYCEAKSGMECREEPYARCLCKEDYVPDGAGTCKDKDHLGCSNLDPPTNGILSENCKDAQEGANCTVSCLPGFTLVGHTQLTCGAGGVWGNIKPTCRESTCKDEHPVYPTWGQYCMSIPLMECKDGNGSAHCVCSKYYLPVTAESCRYPICSDEREENETWSSYCSDLNLKCHPVEDSVPRCKDCKEGFVADHRGNCRNVNCDDLNNVGMVWRTWCRVKNRVCQEVKNGGPRCGQCREGFLENLEDPINCRAPGCHDAMNETTSWMTHCDSLNRDCVPDHGSNPRCIKCKDRFVEGPTEACRPAKCTDKHPDGLVWKDLCEKNPNVVCKDDQVVTCACRDKFVLDGAGGCKSVTEPGCSNLTEPENGLHSGNCAGAEANETCIFECEEGFNVLGHVVLTCKDNGLWDLVRPVCRRKALDDLKKNVSHRARASLTWALALVLYHTWR